MKQIASIIAIFALGSAGVLAGPYTSAKSPKTPVTPPPPPPPVEALCFEAGPSLSLFGAYLNPDSEEYSDELGGGIGLEYFFTENFGVSTAYALFHTTPEIHHVTADFVARYPIRPACIAPYVLGGGGIHSNSQTEGFGRVGGGIDIQIDAMGNNGFFADYVYTFGGDELEDFQTIRLGVKFNF